MGYYLSGIDEAGYGPTLGPLVVGLATVRAQAELDAAEPWRALAGAVGRKHRTGHVAVADSKQLHRTHDLSPLELGVLSFVACERGGATPTSLRELLAQLTDGAVAYLDEYPWYRGRDLQLPVACDPLDLLGATRRLERALERAQLSIAELRARPVDVLEFNRGVSESDSKGEVNARAIGELLKWLWAKRERVRGAVYTDRLGGRQRYGPFLYPLFGGATFNIIEQQEELQIYRVSSDAPRRDLTISFRVDGEDHSFATALASMTAKYVRELHMRLFNSWWQEQSREHARVELKATAGYAQDAQRFLNEIEPWCHALAIDRRALVRSR
ncbi:MAG: hypothetical protein ACKVX7_08730 [Planctomycetota bacterium]